MDACEIVGCGKNICYTIGLRFAAHESLQGDGYHDRVTDMLSDLGWSIWAQDGKISNYDAEIFGNTWEPAAKSWSSLSNLVGSDKNKFGKFWQVLLRVQIQPVLGSQHSADRGWLKWVYYNAVSVCYKFPSKPIGSCSVYWNGRLNCLRNGDSRWEANM